MLVVRESVLDELVAQFYVLAGENVRHDAVLFYHRYDLPESTAVLYEYLCHRLRLLTNESLLRLP